MAERDHVGGLGAQTLSDLGRSIAHSDAAKSLGPASSVVIATGTILTIFGAMAWRFLPQITYVYPEQLAGASELRTVISLRLAGAGAACFAIGLVILAFYATGRLYRRRKPLHRVK